MTQARLGGRRAAGWAALAAGLSASVAGMVLAVHAGRPPEDAGAMPVAVVGAPARDPGAPAAASAPAGRAPSGPAGSAASGPAVSGSTGPAAARPTALPTTPAWGTPTRVEIGSLRVDAPVQAAGVRDDRSLAVPDDPDRLGWWIGSATPGSPRGTVVIAGHVDTAKDGPGVLAGLEKLAMGAVIEVRAADRVVEYRVVARRSYAKQRLPADLFRGGTAPRLALVTCGGSFSDGTYSHNVVVYAEPAAP